MANQLTRIPALLGAVAPPQVRWQRRQAQRFAARRV
jgi:hypothetical protein